MTNGNDSSVDCSFFFSGEPGWKGDIVFSVYKEDKECFEEHCNKVGIDIISVRRSDFDQSLYFYYLPRKTVEALEEVKETVGLRCGCGDCAPELRYEWEW